MKAAIYAGSFDPITNGHLDIIERSAKVFDKIYVLAMINNEKKYTFTIEERVELIKKATKHCPKVEVDSYQGLLVDYCKMKNVYTLVRGLRALTDFDYEFQMATINRKIDDNVESVLFVASNKYSYVSSSVVKELASYGSNVSDIVPKAVDEALKKKLRGGK